MTILNKDRELIIWQYHCIIYFTERKNNISYIEWKYYIYKYILNATFFNVYYIYIYVLHHDHHILVEVQFRKHHFRGHISQSVYCSQFDLNVLSFLSFYFTKKVSIRKITEGFNTGDIKNINEQLFSVCTINHLYIQLKYALYGNMQLKTLKNILLGQVLFNSFCLRFLSCNPE